MTTIQNLLETKKSAGANLAMGEESRGNSAERASGGRNKSVMEVEQSGQKDDKPAPTSDNTSQSMSLLSKVFSSKSKSKSKSPEKKFLDELVVEEDGTKLPMVKFDSDGDFFKEPLEGWYQQNI